MQFRVFDLLQVLTLSCGCFSQLQTWALEWKVLPWGVRLQWMLLLCNLRSRCFHSPPSIQLLHPSPSCSMFYLVKSSQVTPLWDLPSAKKGHLIGRFLGGYTFPQGWCTVNVWLTCGCESLDLSSQIRISLWCYSCSRVPWGLRPGLDLDWTLSALAFSLVPSCCPHSPTGYPEGIPSI